MIDGELVAWVDARLEAAGRPRTGDLQVFRERAWSTVYCTPTDAGTVWLKVCPPDNAFEVGLYEILAEATPQHVLVPLGTDPSRGRLLLPDGGPTAAERTGGDGEAMTNALEAALPAYAQLQQALVPHADRMLAVGVADMTPARLPAVLDRMLAAVRPYVEQRADAAERDDYERLLALRDDYARWCAELAATGRPPSLDHNDLHAQNALDGPRFYDWGDSVLAHPFACLLTPMNNVPEEHAGRMRDAYLGVWGDPVALREEADLAVLVSNPARALVWQRALGARPLEHQFAHAPLYFLRRLITKAP